MAILLLGAAGLSADPPRSPNVLLITVDTLRADRLSSYGYHRPTSPHIDRLIDQGVRFTQARTVEPLTGPAIASILTSRHPHEHGATRNALRIRPGLSSVARILRRERYTTVAFVSNWTLKSSVSGLDEHFHEYEEVLLRKRWLGLFKEESIAEDVTEAALEWLEEWREQGKEPFFMWAHYTDPHAPYLHRSRFAGRLRIPRSPSRASASERYDTEIAAVDHAIGEILEALRRDPLLRDTLVVFTSDHGESFGEHGAWGHGRTLWEEAVRIPLAFVWPGRLPPAVIDAPARSIDIAPTILGILDIESPEAFGGHDWSGVLRSGEAPPVLRTLIQAHRGAVLPGRDHDEAREKGLLEVAVIEDQIKNSYRPGGGRIRSFDLSRDPGEHRNLANGSDGPSGALSAWLDRVHDGLRSATELPAALDAEAVEKLRALGYLQ
ncbi:MAG TPA: sulfatase [Thermoanaerobaculia bacterium]|nr:sulfatase [Thermoanaerobaculia bacterium]